MQSLTEKVLHLAPPGGIFDQTVVRNLFPDASGGARDLLVHRACAAGEIVRLKRGLFVLAPSLQKTTPHPFVIAGLLQANSHVSVESALSFHGLIPEAVYQVGSVCATRSREFQTPLGVFSFRRVPVKNPRAGVEAVKLPGDFWAFVATPLRAIADMVYLSPDVTWEDNGPGFLTESLRIEETDLAALNPRPLGEIAQSFNSRRVRTFLEKMKETFYAR